MRRRRSFTFFLSLFFVIVLNVNAFASKNNIKEIYGKATFEHLNIVSYSKNWTNEKLEQVYKELLKNYTSSEFDSLKTIYLYPSKASNVSGQYFHNISMDKNLNFVYGKNAFINLYNMENINSIDDIAYTLSHEYGHHYTIYNITRTENKYRVQWENTEYAKIRRFSEYPVNYGGEVGEADDGEENTRKNYIWNASEIAANDYVQFCGSKKAKQSYQYKDILQKLNDDDRDLDKKILQHFNDTPQQNPYLPLASQVDNLYLYFIKIGEKDITQINKNNIEKNKPNITKLPEITDITLEDVIYGNQYRLSFSPAEGNSPFEYTIITSKKEELMKKYPIKTLSTQNDYSTVLGTVYKDIDNNKVVSLTEVFNGEYQFLIFAKDKNGFVYSSKPFIYTFD